MTQAPAWIKMWYDMKRRAGSLYVNLLHESARVLRLWMDRAGRTCAAGDG